MPITGTLIQQEKVILHHKNFQDFQGHSVPPPPAAQHCLRALAADPLNTVYVISGRSAADMEACLGDIDGHTYTLKTSDPTGGKKRIFLANNDYYFTGYQGTLCCWAEQSLKVTENILKVHFNMTKPAWLDKKYYADKIARM